MADKEIKSLPEEYREIGSKADIKSQIKEMEKEMKISADNLLFEKAATIRDEINVLKKIAN